MKDIYAVLRQKEIEQSRLKNEVEALRMVAPLLEDGTAEIQSLPRAVNDTPQPDHSGWLERGKKSWQ